MLIRTVCTGCGDKASRLLWLWDGSAVEKMTCKKCGAEVVRKPTGPSSQVVERLDNGMMPKAVERLADAERLYRDRADNSDPLAGGAQHVSPVDTEKT